VHEEELQSELGKQQQQQLQQQRKMILRRAKQLSRVADDESLITGD